MRRARLLAIVAAVLVPLALLVTCVLTDRHPSDSAMMAQFGAKRAAFEELLDMVREEPSVTRIGPGFLALEDGTVVPSNERLEHLSEERLGRYQRLFDLLELEAGVARAPDGSVHLLRSTSGLVTSGSSKSWIWMPRPPERFLFANAEGSTEGTCGTRAQCESFRQIDGNWYVALERH